jgi:hypothetical protein
MRRHFKNLIILSAGFLFVFLSKNLSAQPRGMTMNQVYHVVDKQMNKMNEANRQFQNNMLMNTNWRDNVGQGTIYQVTFKDSTTTEVVSLMYNDTLLHKNFLLFVNKKFRRSDSVHRYQKIYTNQTLYISVIVDPESSKQMFGVPTDSCWMFKVIDGPLTVYAKQTYYLAAVNNPIIGWPAYDFDPYEIVGIQLNDGPIVKYNKENLKQMVLSDPEALAYIEKKKYYKAVKEYNNSMEKKAKK